MGSMMRSIGLAAVLAVLAEPAVSAEYVWIEAERPASVPNIKPPEGKPDEKGYAFAGWGDTSVISEGKLLSLNLGAGEAAARLGRDGAVFGYDFRIASPGRYEVWARIGFEWVRSDFDWRIDGGPWRTLPATRQTRDVQPIQTWNELAWVMLAERDLSQGKHTLQVRHLPQTKTRTQWKTIDGKRKEVATEVPARTLHLSDCFCIYKGGFRPNGKHKPDAEYQTAEDKAAAAAVYELKAPPNAPERAAVQLTGPWQIARWEEHVIREDERLRGVAALPDLDKLFWYGLKLPGDRDRLRPEMAFGHRYIYRTKVKVPAGMKGRGFFLHFENFNMIATVFVNGVRCGWSKACSTEWKCDVTAGIRPGTVNDLAIVFKDCYYAIKDAEKGTRHYWNLPHAWLHNQGVAHRFDMPIAWDTRTGILEPVSLVAAGKGYTTDVFAKPSVRKKQLGVEVTIRNPGPADLAVKVENEVVPYRGGRGGPAEKTFPARRLTVPAGTEKTLDLTADWKDPRLWWPDDPRLYWVVTKLSVDGEVVDVERTRFGFREWTWEGHLFRLNGVKWQLWADCDYGGDPKAWVAKARKSGMNMIRYWRRDGWGGMTRREVLDYMDEQGVPVRDSGIFDGQHALYGLTDGGRENTRAKKALFDNWIHQMTAWVRAERNHPSVFIWSIENEIVYINSWNLGRARWAEPEIRRGAEAVMKLDPTRPVMVDGGRCLLDGSLPVNGAHYNDTSGVAQRDYPDAAYTREHWYRVKHRGAWEMIRNRPIFHGECFFANGYTPAEFAGLGGDRCFIGMSETHAARGLYAKMLSEGWRWCEVAAWHMWFGSADRQYYNAWQPVCVFCRQWNWTFAGGSTVPRTLKVFNSTRHADPIELGWRLTAAGKVVAQEKKTLRIPPGETQVVKVSLRPPAVRERTSGELVLTCSRGGKEVFREVKPLWIIDPDAAPKPRIAPGELVVLDPRGTVKARLAARGIPFAEINSVDEIKRPTRLLIVGADAVPEEKAADPMWHALAAAGTKMLILDQAHPLRYQAVPADFDVTDHTGRIAFSEDLSHPVFAGLAQADFFTWSDDHVVYRNAYKKASAGARSLVQCDRELNDTALSECRVRDGLMLLCQLAVGRKLGSDPVARRLFDNMVNYLAAYAPVRKDTAVVVDAATPKGKLLRSIGLKHDDAGDPVAAISGGHRIAVIDATPANLRKLAAAGEKVRAFTSKGGWIMLWGVTPEGLADYNRLVGHEHLIRPFRMERVVFSAPRDPLTSGLTLRDVVMESSERIARWMAVRWAADDAFTYVLDYDDIGPFLKLPTPAELGKPADVAQPKRDHWPPNLFNGFTADDSWRYCFSIILDRGDKTKWTMELPRPEEIINFSIVLNVIYHKVTKINLYFDDDPRPFTIRTRPTHDRQDFAVDGRKARRITIELAEWEKSGRQNVIGIDNMWIGVKRPERFLENVKPLLNIGALMRYNMGAGGIVLNQLNILQSEKLPVNAEKKANITRVLLRNLGAVFAGGKTVVVGAGLKYTPIPFEDGRPNAYLTRRAKTPWFSHRYDLGHIPVGENTFAGVRFVLADFRTSPVPSCFMLKGHGSRAKDSEIKAIKVGRKCDALFFLHALNATRCLRNWKPPRRGDKTPPTVFQYVVHYADGRSTAVPVIWGRGAAHWLDAKPAALLSAAVAWAAAFEGNTSGDKAVVYSMQWNNPRPAVPIESVDLTYGPDGERWGTPALLAITAAEAAK